MPAPTGTWNINANCETALLQLGFDPPCNGVGSAALTGTWSSPGGATPLTGFWNEEAQKLTFLKMNFGDPDTVQVFTGYLMALEGQFCALAGSFEAFRNKFLTQTVGICERCVFGWYALPG
jgi:hypothetical protein